MKMFNSSSTSAIATSSRRRFDPMSGSWPAVVLNLIVTVALVSVASLASNQTASEAVGWLVFWSASSVLLFVFVAAPLRYFLVRQQRESRAREALLVEEAARREFGARVGRAFDLAQDGSSAYTLADRASAHLLPTAHVDVLIADSSRAHLAVRASSDPPGAPPGCAVLTPAACPAVRSGHSLRFEHAGAIDACPWLVDREPCGSVCVPVSIMGNTVGVIHVAHDPSAAPSEVAVDGVELVARQLGARVGMLAAMSQTRRQADTDPLTGLANRRRLEEDVRALMQDDVPYALILADLDHFKDLNDAHGHEMGDRALRLFAQVMVRNMRDGDLIARYGGEEFVIVCPNTRAAAAADAFDRVRVELAAAVTDGRTPAFTVSAGVADTRQGAAFDDLLRIADELLLTAKRNGRNQVLTDTTSSTAPTSRAATNPTAALSARHRP